MTEDTGDFYVVWGVHETEIDAGERVRVGTAAALTASDLASIAVPAGVSVRACSRSIGKGASGPGIGVVFEHVLNDTASLIAVGVAIRQAAAWISGKRRARPAGAGRGALTAVAASSSVEVSTTPDDWFHTRTVPLTTDGGSGTDMRDVWASAFTNDRLGLVQTVFSSSTTRHLGSVTVGNEWWFDGTRGQIRTDEQLAAALSATFVPNL